MKRRGSLTIMVVTLTTLLAGLTGPLSAQPPAPNSVPPGFNFSFNPAIFGMPAQVGGFVDPLHSAAIALLKRDDVRAQILLTAKQREALDALDAKSSAEMKTMVTNSIK